MYAVFFSNQAKKFLEAAEQKIRQRVKELADVLALSPVPATTYDLRKLDGFDDCYRIRLSSYRLVYRVKWDEKEVHVLKIARRSETTYK